MRGNAGKRITPDKIIEVFDRNKLEQDSFWIDLYPRPDNNEDEKAIYRKFLDSHAKTISKYFKLETIFGYPVVSVMDRKFWPRTQAEATHLETGIIFLRGWDSDSRKEEHLRHELTHAMVNYRRKFVSNPLPDKEFKARFSDRRWYGPLDFIDLEEQMKVRGLYKMRIIGIFQEEIETYYNQGKFSGAEREYFSQEYFNSAFAQVHNFDRPLSEFQQEELLEVEDKHEHGLLNISLKEIYKYDPEFGKELDFTLRIWRLTLSKSSPVTIEKLINYVQAADSFDKISAINLSAILDAAETGIDAL